MKEMKIRFGRYHGRDCETIYQEDRNYCQWVLDVERNEQWEEECRERKRIELEEREAKIEENRRAAEAEEREKERVMKQIRRPEMENEKMESRDNYSTRDDDDTKNFTTETKGSKDEGGRLHDRSKGRQSKGGRPHDRSKRRQSKNGGDQKQI